MKIYKILVFMISFSLMVIVPQRTESSELSIRVPTTVQDIQKHVEYFSNAYDVDPSLILKMIKCESTYKDDVVGDGGRAFGLLQYHESTFIRHSKAMGETLDYYSSYDQIKLGTWAVANGYAEEWTSYVAIKNGGVYRFYSRLMKRWYTVVCK